MDNILEFLSDHWMRILGGIILVVVLFGGSMTPWLKTQWARLTTRTQDVVLDAEDEDVLDLLAIKRLRARESFQDPAVKKALDTLMTHFFHDDA